MRVNGFYRQDGSDTNLPYVYANDSKTTLPSRGTGTENDMQAAAVSFDAGNYLSDAAYVQVTDGTLKIGVATEGTSCWSIFKNFHLAYYGNHTVAEVVLASSVKTYKEALAAAQAYQSADMFDTDKTALNTAINNNIIDLSGNVTEEQLTTAAANLNAAATAAEKAVARYNAYNNIVTAVTGKTDVEITSQVDNLGFEAGNLNGWISIDGGSIATNNNFSGKVGSYYVERWQNGVALGSGSLTHDVISLPKGVYTITANAQNIEQYNNNVGGTGYFFKVNDAQKEIGAAGTYSLIVKYTADVNDVTLAFVLDNCTGNWISCDNVKIVYNGEDFPAVTLVEGKMNADIAAAQTSAKNAYDADATVANYNTLVDAVAAAQASKDAYDKLALAITKIDAALSAATTATASTDDYDAVKTAYNNGTIADANIQAQITAAYNAVIPVIKSQTATSGDFSLAIQNQSFEYGDMTGWTATASSDTGVRETSNPTYAATGSDGNYLFNTWWQGVPLTQTVEGLPNGEYTLTASVASDGATIYLIANGEHNDGTETGSDEVTTYPGKGTLQDATITFLVKDGNATIGVVGGANGTAGEHKDYVADGYWWYKADNFRLVKNRDLTSEEMAVAPTAIALYNGETEVTEPIALDPTTNTVTLTPSYTPAEASEGYIEWTTSDANVATVTNEGVVKAVSSGTAIITVQSTLDESVKTTATVNVSYPESEVAEYTNNGATRYIHDYGANLIKNGTFEYPNPFQGWRSGANGNCDANNYEIVTDGDNKYIKAKESKGAGDSHSISTGWPIEAGKTYVFGYKVKANQAGNSQYHIVSLTNAIGTETSKVSVDETPVTTSWTEVNYTFTNPAGNGFAFVQFRARWLANNTSFDDFYLCEVNSDDIIQGNVDYATAAIPTANIGTGAFQYSQDAIKAANELVQGTATVTEVEAAYEALTTVNAPADDQLFNVILTYGGWTYDQKAMTYMAGDRDDQGGYNIKYNAPANKNLAQAFTFTKVSGNNYKMSQIDADGNVRYMCTAKVYDEKGSTSSIRTTTNADDAMLITVIPTATEGVWNLKNVTADNFVGSQDAGVFTVNSHIDFNIVETTKPSIAINTTAAGYGTTILPFAVASLPEGVKAYTCAEVSGNTLTLEEVTTLEANNPYIIEGAWNATVTGDAQGTALNYTEGLLTGVYAQTDAPVGSYVLQNQESVVGFYKVAEGEGKQPKVGANHAYLTAPSEARALYFNNATAIRAIEVLTSGEVEIYNAAGARQNSLQKGVNIIKQGNKTYKVMVK